MNTSLNTGIPFAKIPPVYASQGDGVKHTKNPELKGFRGELRLVQEILNKLGQTETSSNYSVSLNTLKENCTRTLELVAANQRTENRKGLLVDIDTHKSNLNAVDYIKALNEIKEKLTENLNILTKQKSSQALVTAIDAQLQSFEAINRKSIGTLAVIGSSYEKFQHEAERLRHKIDSHEDQKRPSKEIEETIVFRSKLSVAGEIINQKLDKADSKEPMWKERLENLTKQWNELAVEAAEVNGLLQAINTIKPFISDLLTAKFKEEQTSDQINKMKSAYEVYEKGLFGHEFDSTTHSPKEKSFDDLRTLAANNAVELKQDLIGKLIKNNKELIQYKDSLKPLIETALSKLQGVSFERKPIEANNKLSKHQGDVDQLFAEVHKKNVDLCKDLATQIESAWSSLNDGLDRSSMNLTFIQGTAQFTQNTSKLYVEFQELAKTLRDARKDPKDYANVHKAAIEKWKELDGQIAGLSEVYKLIDQEFTKFMTESAKTLSRMGSKPGDENYVREETIRHFQKEFKEKHDTILQNWDTKLPAISRKVAQELNRGLDAFQVKDYGDNFKNAFVTETRHNAGQTVHHITQSVNALSLAASNAATAIIPQRVKDWRSSTTAVQEKDAAASLPEAAPIVYFKSAFDTLKA